ncbi:hypothetical protein [Evansella tamaricis]|uniref:Uncharacterized protein n=1 Tax=Evansella tamaricis TaxID=2069301 RepID=A0ABS6JET5_9BACI|nr:hypothetical protein [Evansella tamaricis]MBU9712186.1 hypothetical protein [Evansella tamaricis]
MHYHHTFYLDRPVREQNSPFPPVKTELFEESLYAYEELMEQGKIILNSLQSSKELIRELMNAAQESNDEEVDRIIQSTGVSSIVNTSYTPNGVTFTLYADSESVSRCCTLTMYLRWG